MAASTLPVPIRFELPGPEWEPAEPGELGVGDAAFVAVRPDAEGGYTPIISVKGGFEDGPLEPVADQLLASLDGTGKELELVSRRTYGDDDAPALVQTVGLTLSAGGRRLDLRQTQVLVGYVDVHTRRQAVLVHTLTCTYAQEQTVAQEFRRFVQSVRVVTDDDGHVVDPT